MPTNLVGILFCTLEPEKAGLSEIFATRTRKSNRKWPFLIPLKAAVYAASQYRSYSAPAPSSKNHVGLQ